MFPIQESEKIKKLIEVIPYFDALMYHKNITVYNKYNILPTVTLNVSVSVISAYGHFLSFYFTITVLGTVTGWLGVGGAAAPMLHLQIYPCIQASFICIKQSIPAFAFKTAQLFLKNKGI